MKKVFKWFWWFLLLLWQLPQCVIGMVLVLWYWIFNGVKLIKFEDNIFYFNTRGIPGAISLGLIIISNGDNEKTLAHEYGHTFDSRSWGWLYCFVVGLPGIIWAALYDCEDRNFGGMTYYDFCTEKRANKKAGLKVVSYGDSPCQCRLEFI